MRIAISAFSRPTMVAHMKIKSEVKACWLHINHENTLFGVHIHCSRNLWSSAVASLWRQVSDEIIQTRINRGTWTSPMRDFPQHLLFDRKLRSRSSCQISVSLRWSDERHRHQRATPICVNWNAIFSPRISKLKIKQPSSTRALGDPPEYSRKACPPNRNPQTKTLLSQLTLSYYNDFGRV